MDSPVTSTPPTAKDISIMDTIDKIPQGALLTFGAIGFLFLAGKVVSYIRLLLSLFMLPGKNVSINSLNLAD
jgi:hypothetical protein